MCYLLDTASAVYALTRRRRSFFPNGGGVTGAPMTRSAAALPAVYRRRAGVIPAFSLYEF